ncbi:ABC transporter permease [Streptomyces sp. LZ34]
MGVKRAWTISEMTLRDLGRRRGVLVLLVLVPLVFYLGRREAHTGQAIRFVLLGLAFTISTAALFVTCAARSLEPRLRLSGYRVGELTAGRLVALAIVGLLISVPYLAVIAVDQRPPRLAAIAAAMVVGVAVAAPLGMVLGVLMPRELEGALLLMALVGAQMITDPATTSAKVLPFWCVREIATYAIDLTGAEQLSRGLLAGLAYGAALAAAAGVIAFTRLRGRAASPVRRPGHARP